jgi:leader peptidase (prepilin peptidase)/N-methyltransferase
MSFFLYLTVTAWQDGRKKAVSGWIFLFFFVHFLVSQICQRVLLADMEKFPANFWFYGLSGEQSIWILLAGCSIGAALLGISRLTEGALGAGDGIFFVITGLYLGFWRNLLLLSSALFLCSMAGLACLIWEKGKGNNCRKKTLPFLVFAFPAGILLMCI